MDKITYLAELAEGLARWVPERERQDILRYYAEYFEEAGPDREAEVVSELGDPWALSSRLAVEGGYVTWEKAASWRPQKTWPRVLIGTAVGLAVFALVAGVGLLAFNAFNDTRNVSVPVQDPVLTERQATIVDWDQPSVWGEFDLAFMDEPYFLMDGNVACFNSIDVDVSLGNVQVVAGDDFTLSVGWSDAMIGYEPVWEVRDGVFRLRAGSGPQTTRAFAWNDLKELFRVGQLVVDVIITVPQNVVLDKLSVKTGLGDVLVYGVSAETVTAETGLGDVECYGARNVRRLDMSTGMGDVGLSLNDALNSLGIGLKTGMGDIEATLCGSEKDYSYELESGLSLVTVNGAVRGSSAERKGNAPYRLDAASGTGSVNVYVTFE